MWLETEGEVMRLIVNFCGHIEGLWKQVNMEKYPTRSVEYLLAWMVLVWSVRIAFPGDVMLGPHYAYLIALAPEWAWGSFGTFIGVSTIYALIRNGGWKKSPVLRFIGAAFGATFWLLLEVLYTAGVNAGAPDFPMRAVYPVLIFFSLYSCFRCGQDYAAQSPSVAVNGDGR